MSFDSENAAFIVVVNGEQQYSIWPEYKAVPEGWQHAGKRGLRQECLAHIASVWTDMRPLSLQQQVAN